MPWRRVPIFCHNFCFCCQDSGAEMRATQSGCFEPGYFWSNWTGLVVFSMLTEGWPTVWPESPDSIVVGCYGVYSLTAWYPLRKLYDQGTLSFHAPPFFCKDFHFRLLIFLSCFSFFFPQLFPLFFFFFTPCARFHSRTTGGAFNPRYKTRIQDQSTTLK